eukprot:scaffold2404_cov398-Prasinococcus_capsulatus_cf.AAC.4
MPWPMVTLPISISFSGVTKYMNRLMLAVVMPRSSCMVGARSNIHRLMNMVRSMDIDVAYTFTIVSAYFITQDTRSPVKARLNTTHHVMKEYPFNPTISHVPW